MKDESEHLVDGVRLSENGLSHLSNLLSGIETNVFSLRKKKRAMSADQGEQGILDSIESVIAAGVQGGQKLFLSFGHLNRIRICNCNKFSIFQVIVRLIIQQVPV